MDILYHVTTSYSSILKPICILKGYSTINSFYFIRTLCLQLP